MEKRYVAHDLLLEDREEPKLLAGENLLAAKRARNLNGDTATTLIMYTPSPFLTVHTSITRQYRRNATVRTAVFTVITIHAAICCGFLASGYNRSGEFIGVPTSGALADFTYAGETKSKPNSDDKRAVAEQSGVRVFPGELRVARTKIPIVPAEPQSAPEPANTRETIQSHQHYVAKGETFTSIGKSYDVSSIQIAEANPGVDPRRLKIGLLLAIPHLAKSSTDSNSNRQKLKVNQDIYVVKKGNTLSEIALDSRIQVATLKTLNSLHSDRIFVGQRLRLVSLDAE